MGKNNKSSFRHIIFKVIIIGIIAVIGFSAAGLKWFSRDLPSMARLEMIEPALKTRILAADSTVLKEFYTQDRILTSIEEIPENVKKTFIAVEDRRFYNHFGIDFIRIMSAAWEDIKSRSLSEGASTITQQLARDLFLTKERTFPRKIKEILLALRIERTYTKDEILQMYLNQIYFGGGSYGVESASREFFGKPLNELNLNQIALLAGLQKNPAGYNPFRHPDRAVRRRNTVLNLMAGNEIITRGQLDSLKTLPLDIDRKKKSDSELASYFTRYIKSKLSTKYGDRAVYREGFTVYTTLNTKLQRAAEDSLESFLRDMEEEAGYELTREIYLDSLAAGSKIEPAYIQSAALAMNPNNGHILVMVGGRNFQESKWNRVTQAKKQPGSAFKIFTYITALKNGYRPSDMLLDSPLVIEMPNGEVWKPRNFSEKFHGSVSLRYALDHSINVPTIKLLKEIGPPSVVNTAKSMGINSPIHPYYSLALGTEDVSLLELTTAYGVLAAEGIHSEPMAILKIEDRNGNVLEENYPSRREVLSPEIAYLATDMLKSVIDEGTGKNVRRWGLSIPCAGKTGTTDDCGNGWFLGYTPEIVVGVWTGFDKKKFMGRRRTGARVALPIWVDIMKAAYPLNRGPEFKRPPGIAETIICEDTGLLATPYCKNVRREIFLKGTEPERKCDLHSISKYDLNSDKEFPEMDKALQED
ncbi:MAG TPA: PBP1A family penicillin-binding protein [Candidatus Krumholzibacteriaceae bacterium]|nr:PBP1A family penicillin-binding protein [Candidatus Krumholzibacteriaceae bacterium]